MSRPMPAPRHSQLWAGRTIGLLGGSFNPAHEGHRHISLYALKYLGLDAVWWMVSPQNPLKPAHGMAPLSERLQGAHAAGRHPQIYPTDIETKLGTRYTADTLIALRRAFPATRFVWLMGMDNLQAIHKWKRWQDIFKTVHVAVLDRPPRGNSFKTCPAAERFRHNFVRQEQAIALKLRPLPAWTVLRTPLSHQSATAIRELRKKEKQDKMKA